jgi:hypothetical protein
MAKFEAKFLLAFNRERIYNILPPPPRKRTVSSSNFSIKQFNVRGHTERGRNEPAILLILLPYATMQYKESRRRCFYHSRCCSCSVTLPYQLSYHYICLLLITFKRLRSLSPSACVQIRFNLPITALTHQSPRHN